MEKMNSINTSLPKDIRKVALAVVRGHELRKARLHKSGTPFDEEAVKAVEKATEEICQDIPDEEIRKQVQKKVLDSIVQCTHFFNMGECYCGRDKFYHYRGELLFFVAEDLHFIKRSSA